MLFAGGDVRLARAAEAAGVERIVVDLERRAKRPRQHGYHLESSSETLADLKKMRAALRCELVCRVNPIHTGSKREIEAVLRAGADSLMLPMFKTRAEVERFLALVAGRARTILLFETREALALARGLAPCPFDEAYVGLNDLSLALGRAFAYVPLADGTVDRLRRAIPRKPFGFGGLTVLDGGAPLPTRQIVAELARLRCSWVILRRAFRRDIEGRDMSAELRRLRAYYARRAHRPESRDRLRLRETVADIIRLV